MRRPNARLVLGALLVLLAALMAPAAGWAKGPAAKTAEGRMSAMGGLAVRARAAIEATHGLRHIAASSGENCQNEPECEGEDEEDEDASAGGQAEVSIAVDSTGQHVVIGYNDSRGFALNPVSLSGFLYSDDGGVTFVDGGQLPSPGTDLIGTTRLPQVFGDPDIRYLGGCNFVYASIVVARFSATRTVQTLGVHRSSDCGHTWTGPFVIPAASNPHGAVTAAGAPRDTADKEFIDVDPDTGRVLVTWSNFSPFAPGGVEISSTWTDDVLTGAPPAWSARQIIAATAADGQSSQPRFAGQGSPNAYAVWRRFPSANGNTIGFSRSVDTGATWSAPVDLSSEFFTMDQVLGNDRVNTSPSVAVDTSSGQYSGNVYAVYANNGNHDGADVAFQKSTDGGLSFSAPLLLDSRPGNDRAQWFPWVIVDTSTGRIWVFYYDQGIATNGQRTEVTTTFSDDGGTHWSPPAPLTDRPFKAGWGNDTGQPNLGDYNGAVAQGGELFAGYAVAVRPVAGFADGQPGSASMNTPDVFLRRVDEDDDRGEAAGDSHPASRPLNAIPLDIVSVAATDSGGNGSIDPGETVRLSITLRNYVTNPLNAYRIESPQAHLASPTPGVTVTQDHSSYPTLNAGASGVNKKDLVLSLSPAFVPGTPIELVLTVRGQQNRKATLLHTLFTGTPVTTTLFSESFDTTAPGLLPAGWAPAHGGGANTVPWTTSSTFCGGSNGAFHQNANDGGGNIRFERLFSPTVVIPATAEYVTLDFDVCYDTEDDPAFNILAYDGFLLRITDSTPGRVLRSELLEAFEDEFTTGTSEHFPKHFPRNSNTAYFQDMSAWAGFSNGLKHVHLRLPGMAGSTVQLRFEFTQDTNGICSDVRPGHTCGVFVDNIVLRSAVSAP
jgi:hypothetical protein